ncbi:MAG TPA: NAD(P)-binding protein [Bacillales bacterium]|nr:NAD(P)-binding protein [Bacillales bacterium]
MKSYPISLRLAGKQVVVIGGGAVAERKILNLLNAGAIITVVSPAITATIQSWLVSTKINWKKKYYEDDDSKDAFLIIAATDDRTVNQQVLEASGPHQLINVVDNPEGSNFFVPSTLHRGKLSISVSTLGASPGLSKKIVTELASKYEEYYEEYLDFLFETRKYIQKTITNPDVRRELLSQLLDEPFPSLSKEQQYERREQLMNKLMMQRRDLE